MKHTLPTVEDRNGNAYPLPAPRTEIEITQDDLDAGKPGEAGTCAVAVALRRMLKPGVTVRVFDNEANLYAPTKDGGATRYNVPMPEVGRRLIRRFDKEQAPGKRTFTLRIPPSLLREPDL